MLTMLAAGAARAEAPKAPPVPETLPEARGPDWGAEAARQDWVGAPLGLGHLAPGDRLPGFGHAWLEHVVLPLYTGSGGAH